MSKKAALERFPLLKQEGLIGALVYSDGQVSFALLSDEMS